MMLPISTIHPPTPIHMHRKLNERLYLKTEMTSNHEYIKTADGGLKEESGHGPGAANTPTQAVLLP